MRAYAYSLLIALVSVVAPAWAEDQALTEAEVVRLTLERNQHVRGARMSVDAAEARTGHLGRSFLPHLEASVGSEHFRTGTFSPVTQPFGEVTATLNLFRGGRDLLEERVRENDLARAQAEAEGTVLEELTKARKAYWQLVFNREMVALLEDAVKRNQSALQSAQRRIGAGLGTDTDRLEFELNQTNLEQDLTRVRIQESTTQRELNVLLGFPETATLSTPLEIPHTHDEDLVRESFEVERNREIRALEAQHQASLAAASKERRWWTPEVSLFGGYALMTFREREYPSLNDRIDAVAGAKLSFSLFDGGAARSEALALQREADALETRKIQSRRELSARIQGATQELKLTHELIHGAEQNVELAQRYLKSTLSEYTRGVKNSPDVSGANLKYIEAKRRWAELNRDYQFARAELLSLLGKH